MLEDCRVSIIAERQPEPAAGRARRRARRPGRNLVNGEEVPAKETRELRAGDVVTIETPGGAGWGD